MELAMRYYRLTHTWRVPASWMPAWSHNDRYLLQVMQEYLIASSHSSAVASAEHTGKGLLHLLVLSIIHGHEGHFCDRSRQNIPCSAIDDFDVHSKKIETVLFKTRNMQPDYRERVIWNMHSVVVQCLYLPTSMLLLTLAMMGAWALEAWASCGFPKTTS